MSKIKTNIYVPDKNFSGEGSTKEITVTMKEPDKKGNVLFEANIPQHVFDKLKNTSEEYKTKEEGGKFRKKVSLPIYKYVCESIQNYCYDAEKIEEMKNLNKQKKIFINFSSNNKKTRDNWCGASTGNSLNIHFQFFVGYKTSTVRRRHFEEKDSECIRYLSEHTQLFEGGPGAYKKGTLQPLNMDWDHKKVENKYTIIDWTQEREKYLKEIEEKFNELGIKLNQFLGDLSGEKLDNLIENSFKLLS